MSRPAKIVIVQTHVPAFRLQLFQELYARTAGRMEVWSGLQYFTPITGTPADHQSWHRSLRNRFLFGRSLLWQRGHFAAALGAELCVLEFNPRIISTWLILLIRRLDGRKSIFWGHLYPRFGRNSPTKILRFIMLAISDGFNAYTHSEAELLRRLRPRSFGLLSHLYINVAPNAIMWERDCYRDGDRVGNRSKILVVGRLIAEKRPAELLESFFYALPRLPPTVTLEFIGDGPMLPRLRQMIEEMNIADRVFLHGEIFEAADLKQFYEEALLVVSPGYIGLSATQAFGFGAPMLIARGERHSVEIELCHSNVNCEFYPSDDREALTDLLVKFIATPPEWALRHGEISATVRNSYTLDRMCDGFATMFDRLTSVACRSRTEAISIVIAWVGLPYYAACVIAEAIARHPEFKFTVISSRDHASSDSVSEAIGQEVRWIPADTPISWKDLALEPPDLFIITSWPHVAYQALAREARSAGSTHIVSMVDNYLRYTLKQLAGFLYFRLRLRPLYSAMWVPGEYSRKFMRFLGVDKENIYTGLYAADPGTFSPPFSQVGREGLIFVGQFIRRKGVDQLALAAAKFRDRIGLKLIGSGPMEGRLKTWGLAVERSKAPAELAEEYRRASALILPSRIDHWGVVIHEAALCGCLLLVTRQCGASCELVQHRANGYIMERSSAKEIEAAVSWLLGLTELEIARGRQLSIARARTISPARWVDTLEEILDRYVLKLGPA
jgi:glycosyltransferase involved in cell wall biosynthesis